VDGVSAAANVVVAVEDAITVGLAGREGCSYASPPLPLDEALTLVRVLTGRATIEAEDGRWTCPIAGGRRTVTLGEVATRGGQPANGPLP
jgi:hypothetical protein